MYHLIDSLNGNPISKHRVKRVAEVKRDKLNQVSPRYYIILIPIF